MNENEKPINTISLKPFYMRDLVVYFATLLIILLLFVFFVFPSFSKNAKEGFVVSVGDKTAVTINFNLGNPVCVYPNFTQLVKVQLESEGFIITIYTSTDKEGFNKIFFNSNSKTAKVTESNCSHRKDCVHTPHITTSNGTIICAPHALKVAPVSFKGDGTIIVG